MSTEESSRRAYARGERPRPVRRHGFEVRASATSTPWSGHVPTCHHLGGIQCAWKRWSEPHRRALRRLGRVRTGWSPGALG